MAGKRLKRLAELRDVASLMVKNEGGRPLAPSRSKFSVIEIYCYDNLAAWLGVAQGTQSRYEVAADRNPKVGSLRLSVHNDISKGAAIFTRRGKDPACLRLEREAPIFLGRWLAETH